MKKDLERQNQTRDQCSRKSSAHIKIASVAGRKFREARSARRKIRIRLIETLSILIEAKSIWRPDCPVKPGMFVTQTREDEG